MSQTIDQDADYPANSDFDPLDPDYLADPYPYFARLRRKTPVFYAPKIDFWVLSCYEDIQNVVKDPETFSNVRVQEPLHSLTDEAQERLKQGVRVTPTTSTADPPLHRRTGKHAARAFSAKRVAGLEDRILRGARRYGGQVRVPAPGVRSVQLDRLPRRRHRDAKELVL
jgi:cytochrome P450